VCKQMLRAWKAAKSGPRRSAPHKAQASVAFKWWDGRLESPLYSLFTWNLLLNWLMPRSTSIAAIAMDDIEWGTKNEKVIREFGTSGDISVAQDERWDEGLATWNVLRGAQL
jgi:hypothetical protein